MEKLVIEIEAPTTADVDETLDDVVAMIRDGCDWADATYDGVRVRFERSTVNAERQAS